MARISILTKYPSQGASSRYRFFLYLNTLFSHDVHLDIDSFFDTGYLDRLYFRQKRSLWRLAVAYVKRFFFMLNSAELLLVEYECFPLMPYWFENLFLRKKRYILNFDDNVWENYRDNPFLRQKYDRLVENAEGIIVANDFLYEKVKAKAKRLIKIPTVIDLETYRCDKPKFEHYTLVWIGTPVTYRYILSHADLFKKLATQIDYELVVIASKKLESEAIEGVNMRFFDWSASLEAEILMQSHVGIMPLDTDAFSEGKSAFKLIQYMGAGIPSVSSAVGENRNVIKDGENGFIVDSEDQWINTILRLKQDETLYQTVSNEAKKRAYDFSIQRYGALMSNFIKQCGKPKGKRAE